MFHLFRRKSKAKSIEPVTETSNHLRPPPYQSSDSSTIMTEKQETFDPHLDTCCLCHARYHVLKSSIGDIHAKYLTLPPQVQKKDYTIWATGRIGALLGIVRAPSSPCTQECQCHDEYKILKCRLEADERGTQAIRDQTSGKHNVEYTSSYERWIAEVHYLHGMLRVCPGKEEK